MVTNKSHQACICNNIVAANIVVSFASELSASAITAFSSRQRVHEVQLITSKATSNILPICLHRESINIYFLFPGLITS